jgi:hypothetical protein
MAEHYDLFLSYARGDDEPFVRRLFHDLTDRGFQVWWDRECLPSRALTFLQEIRDAIEASERLMVILGFRASPADSSCPSGTTPICPLVVHPGWRWYEPSASFPFRGQ